MKDVNIIWDEALDSLKGSIIAVSYMLWIDNLYPLCIVENELVLVCPTANAKKTVNQKYKDDILVAVQKSEPLVCNILALIESEKESFIEEMNIQSKDIAVKEVTENKVSPFMSRYTFDNFVVGESNKLAFHSAKMVAENPGSSTGYLNFNPLFIYGGVGLGKTHLLHSIGNYITNNLPKLKILYVPTEKLINDFIEALSDSSTNKNSFKAFREKYRSVDVLMLDDVQFLQKKSGLQDVIFHIFNELYQNGKQIILSSDRPPKDIGTLEDRLRSRFEGGLLADIGVPTLEMRIAIIRKKMILEKIAVNDDVVLFLAEKIDTNIRELEGALSKIILFSQLLNKPFPDVETAKEALKVNENEIKKEGIDSEDIISAVSTYFRINESDIVGKKKTKDIVEARMIAIYLVNDLLNLPLVTIGQIFGGRDHTTVIHSRDKILSLMEENKDTQRKIKDIRALLASKK